MRKEDFLELKPYDKIKFRNSDNCQSEVISNDNYSEILTLIDCVSEEIRMFRYQELIDRGLEKI